MAPPNRREIFGIKGDLLQNSRRYSFIQAERLLRYWLKKSRGDGMKEKDLSAAIRVRPHLSLDFPETDITSISEYPDDADRFLITTTFLGLYGVSSPLPTFYTEDLMDEMSEDITVTRDFLDIINAPFYRLFFRCWDKYRAPIKVVEEKNPSYLERVFCLLGFGTRKLRDSVPDEYRLLRYIGLFTQFPRSAMGLKTLLSDAMNLHRLDVIQCIPRMAVIPEDQRCYLGQSGNIVGEDAYLGFEIADRMGAFRIQAGPVDADAFHRCLPDTETFHTMARLVNLYLDQPLEWDFEVILGEREVRTTCLGGDRWSRLGWDTWTLSDETIAHDVSVRFHRYEEYMAA